MGDLVINDKSVLVVAVEIAGSSCHEYNVNKVKLFAKFKLTSCSD